MPETPAADELLPQSAPAKKSAKKSAKKAPAQKAQKAEKRAAAPKRPDPKPVPEGFVLGLEPSPFDLSKPDAPNPARLRTDPRHPDQTLTAFWVLAGEGDEAKKIGRVVMFEYTDKGGWFYQAQAGDPTKPNARPKDVGEPWPRRTLAVAAVVEAWQAAGGKLK